MSRNDGPQYSGTPHINHDGSRVTGGGVTITRVTEGSNESAGVNYSRNSGVTVFGDASKKVGRDTQVNGFFQASSDGNARGSVGFSVDF